MSTESTDLTPPNFWETPEEELPFHKTPFDRQLVRTTFRLSHEALEARAWLAGRMKASMADALARVAHMGSVLDKYMTPVWARKAQERDIRRTIVLSRGALSTIEDKAEALGVHRDEVLEAALQLCRSLMANEAEETAALHKQVQPSLEAAYDYLLETEKELKDQLGSDDPVLMRLGYVLVMMDNLMHALEQELANGTPVDPDEF